MSLQKESVPAGEPGRGERMEYGRENSRSWLVAQDVTILSLRARAYFGKLGFPNYMRPATSLAHRGSRVANTFIVIDVHAAIGGGHIILAGSNVRMTVRLRRRHIGRGALLPCLFCLIPNCMERGMMEHAGRKGTGLQSGRPEVIGTRQVASGGRV